MILKIAAYIVIGFYTLALTYVTFYCFLQFHLLLKYWRAQKNKNATRPISAEWNSSLPMVTIQLPIFNERYVVERLIDNIVHLHYPAEKLEIQVLDDSTDETADVCRQKVKAYKNKGYDIHLIHRSNRDGYKAGALRDGLLLAKGEFIAIFDADFLPKPDFLLQTLPCFKDTGVGAVQTRWEHINGEYSLITRLQAFQLNMHFTIEQTGRQWGNYFLQFNGSAGVWRRKTIEDAGGWETDTLTEDLDLSYRAQLKGWRIKYRQDIVTPSELPCEMNGLKSQQFRWMKGGAENARKLIPAIFRSEMPFIKKMHATTHLLSSSVFLFIFILGILSVPSLFLMSTINMNAPIYWIFTLGVITASCVYFVGNKDSTWIDLPLYRKMLNFAIMFPLFLSLSMGLSLHNSIAVIQGYRGRKSAFVRTPKFNIQQLQDSFKKGLYEASQISGITLFEGLLALYFLIAVIIGVELGKTSLIVYHLMLMIGFGSIFIYSIKHLSHR